MLLSLAVLLSVQASPAVAEPSTADPIVVTANRLDAVRFNLSVNRLNGQMKCNVARSSGNPAIDAYMCDVAKYCASTRRKTRSAIEKCIAEHKKAYLIGVRRTAG